VADNPRIEELRRRVQADPASIAFAALAEEYRRNGDFEAAIDTCRVGLQRHPSYLSARVTLGRALIAIGDRAAARTELEAVLKAAPENLAAIRAMAEIHGATETPAIAPVKPAASPLPAAPVAVAAPAPAPPRPSPIPLAAPGPAPIPVSEPRPAAIAVSDAKPAAIPISDARPAEAPARIAVSSVAVTDAPDANVAAERPPAPNPVHDVVDRAVLQRAVTVRRLESFLASIEAARTAAR
jgi:tetratricopeptide (TPR) repeat protein